jgi:hypothetical protein
MEGIIALLWLVAAILGIVQFVAVLQLFGIRKDLKRLTEHMVQNVPQVPTSPAEAVMTTKNDRTPYAKPRAEAEPPISKEETDRRYNEWLAKKK